MDEQELVRRAIAFYEANRYEIREMLPGERPWVRVTRSAIAPLEKMISLYRAGELSPTLARRYVLEPIRTLRDLLQEKRKENSDDQANDNPD